jgi:hypothetical protein
MHFEAPISEWFLTVMGDNGVGIVDIFRDIYIFLPNDGAHTTMKVIRTSAAVTIQHWGQHFTSGIKHLSGRLDYGNAEVIRRFVTAARSGTDAPDIGPADAIAVLDMQHSIIDACAASERGNE